MLLFKLQPRFLIVGIIFISITTFVNGQDEDEENGEELDMRNDDSAGRDDQSERYQYHAIMAINTLRVQYESDHLVMSDELNRKAIKCAEKIKKHKKEKLKGEPKCDIKIKRNGKQVTPGKILYQRGFEFKGKNDEEIVKYNLEDWTEFGEKYWENNEKRTNETDHFTMVVWNSTTEAGYGCNDYWPPLFCIGLFYPAGNIKGKFPDNVFPKPEN